MALPHIQNSTAGRNKFEPVNPNLFEVRFTLPEPLRAEFGKDELLLTEHVLSIGGLQTLNKAPEIQSQKFMGTTRSYIAPGLDDTSHELSIVFSINLRNAVDNYIYKLFRAWAALGYNTADGSKRLKTDYCADWLVVKHGNRVGDVFHEVIYKDVMIAGGLEYIDELSYESTDPAQLTVKFKSDWATETQA